MRVLRFYQIIHLIDSCINKMHPEDDTVSDYFSDFYYHSYCLSWRSTHLLI